MSGKHAQSPWRVVGSTNNQLGILDKGGGAIALVYARGDVRENANLIAQSPALLAIAESLISRHDSGKTFITVAMVKNAQSVVAKVNGVDPAPPGENNVE